jgi:DNA polymerase-3 subunit delta
MPKNNISPGQCIRRIRANKIVSVYALFGGDPFLEDCIIDELSNAVINGLGAKLHFSMDQDLLDTLLSELSSISLFEEKRIIIVREIKKIRSERGRKELIQHIESSNSNNILVLISEEYDMKNSFLKQISNISEWIDVRTPFEGEIKKWVIFFIKKKNIKISDAALNEFIQLYGDSISHVVNEIEKMSLMLGKEKEIKEEIMDQLYGSDRLFSIWHLQDSLGKKDLKKSLKILDSLLRNGIKITFIVMNIVFLYQQMTWRKMGRTRVIGYIGINKIISSRLKYYDNNYTYFELMKSLQDLREIDILSKSISLNERSLLEPFLVKTCRGINV